MASGSEATSNLDCQARNPQLGTTIRSQALKQTPQVYWALLSRALGLSTVLNLAGNS